MRLSTAVALALVVLLVAFTGGTAAVAPATAATPTADESLALSPTQSQSAPAVLESSVQETDGEYEPERADTWQVFRLNVTDDGDVRWTIESRFVVAENETDDFEAYAEAVADGDRSVGYDADRYERFRAEAERSTGREMTLENAGWNEPRLEPLEGEDGESDDDRKLGVISYSFTWTNFAVVDEQRIRFGDAFVTDDDGVWFPVFDSGQRLVVESPANYGVETAPSGIRDGTVVRDGPVTLGAEDFQIVFLRSGASTPNGASFEWGALLTPLRVGLAFGGFVLILVVASLAISRYQRSEWPFDGSLSDDTAAEHRRSAETDGSGTATADASGVEHEFDETEAVSATDSDADADTDEDEPVDVELLSDEERVRRMLERNGGRMKQATIVKETGWSDAKVSQLLSEMDDEDRIQKLRIGRENLITLPDVDPTEMD